MCIPIGPLFYEVGPDVSLAADTFRAKQLHDEYTETPEYMALLRGALSMMKVSHIDLLVVGLPVALFAVKKAALEKAMTGRHDIGGSKAVTVGKAMAVAQPQGALAHFASEHQKMTIIGNEQSLVIDPGSRTFDWLVARGMRFVQKQSLTDCTPRQPDVRRSSCRAGQATRGDSRRSRFAAPTLVSEDVPIVRVPCAVRPSGFLK